MARAAMSLVTIHIDLCTFRNTTRASAYQHKPCLNWSKVSGLGTTDPFIHSFIVYCPIFNTTYVRY